ncbi:MAG: iduronate sulfatase [Opitutus sp.]|nr:iduronate sulfatase [Opitutus sp.]
MGGLLLAGHGAATCAPLGDESAAVEGPRRLNVLLLAVDDLRPELGCYGTSLVRTPQIDRFAQSATVFERAYCQFPLCAPSRASFLTGTRPDTTRVQDLYSDFRVSLPRLESMPQNFKNRGYFTDRFGKIFHIDDVASWTPTRPLEQFGPAEPAKRAPYANPALNAAGWKKFDAAKAAGLTGMALERSQRGPALEITDLADDALPDGKIAAEAIAALQRLRRENQPFFLAVGFLKPHLPFVAPRKYWDLYDESKITLPANRVRVASPVVLGDGVEFYTYTDVPGERPVPDDYARQAAHGYLACVSFVDAQIGRVLDELDRLGLTDDTIVVLWGDHGFKLGEHGGWGKLTNFEVDARVPLIIRAPGKGQGRRVRALVEAVDVFPTLLELTHGALPAQLEGSSLVPLLDNAERTWKTAAFTQCRRDGEDWSGQSIRTDQYRLTRWSRPGEMDSIELYDHNVDPDENNNLADLPANTELRRRLLTQLAAGWTAARPK